MHDSVHYSGTYRSASDHHGNPSNKTDHPISAQNELLSNGDNVQASTHRSMDNDDWFDSDIAYFTRNQYEMDSHKDVKIPTSRSLFDKSQYSMITKPNKDSHQSLDTTGPTRLSSASRIRALSQKLQTEQLQHRVREVGLLSETVPQRTPQTSSVRKRIIDQVYNECDQRLVSETALSSLQTQEQPMSRTGVKYSDSLNSRSLNRPRLSPVTKRARVSVTEPSQRLPLCNASVTANKTIKQFSQHTDGILDNKSNSIPLTGGHNTANGQTVYAVETNPHQNMLKPTGCSFFTAGTVR